ncbi:hypothetical protein MBANPS3_005636 [Mucor bainieri]
MEMDQVKHASLDSFKKRKFLTYINPRRQADHAKHTDCETRQVELRSRVRGCHSKILGRMIEMVECDGSTALHKGDA